MTNLLIAGDAAEPREWDIGNRTLIISVGQRHALGVLTARHPLLLPWHRCCPARTASPA
jgi:hypothetical protein